MVRTIFKEAVEARNHSRLQALWGYILIGMAAILFVWWFVL